MGYPSFVVCHQGMEDVAAREIAELTRAKKTEVAAGGAVVRFNAGKKEDLLRLIYLGQSIHKVAHYLGSCNIEKGGLENIKTLLRSCDYRSFIDKDDAFRVKCRRVGDHDFSSNTLAEEAGEAIIAAVEEQQGFKPGVDLEEAPVTVFICLQGNDCTVGIDLCPLDLSKRPYRLFTTALSLKATLAYSLLRLAGFSKREVLVDPFCRDGLLPIEAALKSNGRSAHAFTKDHLGLESVAFFHGLDTQQVLEAMDREQTEKKIEAYGYASQLHFLANAKKNAKIADVHKLVEFSKVDVEWLDTKFDKGTVDLIVTRPPETSARVKSSEIEKLYKELFYQADFVLASEGKIAVLTNSVPAIEKWAGRYRFKKQEDRRVWQGKMALHAMVFVRSEEGTEEKEE
ncbi:MAG: hypothetical protein GXP63_06945 [DPANN group archaeon]|nr:hypothetical protein [DPANN group archaeon]